MVIIIIHTVPKFFLRSSRITGSCHYTHVNGVEENYTVFLLKICWESGNKRVMPYKNLCNTNLFFVKAGVPRVSILGLHLLLI